MEFKVQLFQDNIYEVLEYYEISEKVDIQLSHLFTSQIKQVVEADWVSVYQGSLSDCEAYIRLRKRGYLE